MKESEVEQYFVWAVEHLGGKTWKFKSPSNRGVADRIACLPDGSVWFVELKRPGGRLSPLQRLFSGEMQRLNQRYACLWDKEQVNAFIARISGDWG